MINVIKNIGDISISEGDIGSLPKTSVDSGAVSGILTVVFGIFATVAVLIIVIAGLFFVLSRGNPEKAGKARNTIIYAAVGLVLSMSAFAIVEFVVGNAL